MVRTPYVYHFLHDIQHNDSSITTISLAINKRNDTQHDINYVVMLSVAIKPVMLSTIMLNFIMLRVFMLSVVAPYYWLVFVKPIKIFIPYPLAKCLSGKWLLTKRCGAFQISKKEREKMISIKSEKNHKKMKKCIFYVSSIFHSKTEYQRHIILWRHDCLSNGIPPNDIRPNNPNRLLLICKQWNSTLRKM